MEDDEKIKPRLEIAHVLFIDIVGYSKLLTDEQSEALQELNQIVRNTEAVREAQAAGQLIILPTGDGMAMAFTGSVEGPAECALEISQALHAQPSVPVRMGIHSGPVQDVRDANARENISGVGINIARRVMDCGDAGHILVSKRFAGDLGQHRRWQRYLHESRRCGSETRSCRFVGQSLCRDDWQPRATGVCYCGATHRVWRHSAQRTFAGCVGDLCHRCFAPLTCHCVSDFCASDHAFG